MIIANMVVNLLADTTRLERDVMRAVRSLDSTGQMLQRSGLAMTAAITAPLVGFGVASVKAFSDFDDAMTKSTAIMGDVSDTMRDEMEAAARDVGRTTTFSATQAAESYFFLASAGLDAAQSIEAMPRVARFAQAGNFDLALATDLLTDAQSALGMTVRDDVVKNMENMNRVSDVLVKANVLANASVQQFSEALTNQAGPAIKSVGKDIEEGVAVLAAFADQGIKGQDAGTKFSIVMRDLQTKAIENAGAFSRMNIAVFDSHGEMNNLGDIVGDVEQALGGMSDAQKKATLGALGFTDKSVGVMLSLLGTSDAIHRYEGALRSAGGITDEVAAKQLSSFKAQLQILLGKLNDVAITIGGSLAPTLTDLAEAAEPVLDWLAGAAQWFASLPGPVRGFVVALTGVVAALGPLVFLTGSFMTSAAAMAPLMKLLGSAFSFVGLTGSAAGTGGTAAAAGATAAGAASATAAPRVALLSSAMRLMSQAALFAGSAVAGWEIGKWIGDWKLFGKEQMSLSESFEFGATKLFNWARGVEATDRDIETAILSRRKLGESTSDAGTAHDEFTKQLEAFQEELEAAGTGVTLLTDETEKAQQEFQKLVDGMRGIEKFKEANDTVRALGIIGGATRLTADEAKELAGKLVSVIQKYEAMGTQAPPAVLATAVELSAMADRADDATDAIALLGLEIQKSVGSAPPLLNQFDPMKFVAPLKGAVQDTLAGPGFFAGFGTLLNKRLGPTILGAIQGGGDVGGAIGSLVGTDMASRLGTTLAKQAPKFMSTALGGALGSVLPGVGAMIGPLLGDALGKAWDGLKSLFGGIPKEVQEARTSVEGFQQTLAGMLTEQQRAEAGGQQWKMTVIAVRDAFLATGRSADEAMRVVEQLWDTDHPDRARAAIEAINRVLDEQQGILDANRQELEDLYAQMESLTEQSTVSWQDMEDAAKRYGIDLAGLGPAFQSARLHDSAQQIWDDFVLLRQGGADVGTVLSGMGDEISQLVRDSIAFGTSIPENFRPLVDELMNSGQLIGENGEALTDLSGLQFGDPIVAKLDEVAQSMLTVAQRIEELVQKIGGDMVAAAGAAGNRIVGEFGRATDAAHTLGDAIDETIEMQSPTGLEGIAHYAGLAGDALLDMAARGVSGAVALKARFDDAAGTIATRMGGTIAAVNGQLGDLLKRMEFVRGLETIGNGDVASVATIPLVDAIARANKLAVQYRGSAFSQAELDQLGDRFGYAGEAFLSEQEVERFLSALVKTYLGGGESAAAAFGPGPLTNPDVAGPIMNFDVGTLGRFGSFFHNWGPEGRVVRVHNDEAIVRRDQAGAFASAHGGGEQTIIVNLDGQTVARTVARNFPRVLSLQGVPT